MLPYVLLYIKTQQCCILFKYLLSHKIWRPNISWC